MSKKEIDKRIVEIEKSDLSNLTDEKLSKTLDIIRLQKAMIVSEINKKQTKEEKIGEMKKYEQVMNILNARENKIIQERFKNS